MKKATALMVLTVMLAIGARAQMVLGVQEAINTLMTDPMNRQNIPEATSGSPSSLATRGGIFDPPADMYNLIGRIDKANSQGMTKRQMTEFINELTQYIVNHPKQRIHGYMQLGNLYRNVLPERLRNRDRAIEMYNRVCDLLPAGNRTDRGQIHYIIAHCYEFDGTEGDISRIAIYMSRAFKDCPRYACSMGDLYLCGWGCYQDFHIATLLYDLAQRNGDETAYNNLYTLDYIVHKTRQGNLNDAKAIEHFRKFLYYLRLANNIGKAESELLAAAQLGFVPSYYILGTMYERLLPGIPEEQRRREMFYWFRKGTDADFIPCITALARCTQQYTMDSLKGDIHSSTSPKIQAQSAKQSLELYTRAANLGGAMAMHILGDLYAKGGPANYPNQDLAMAYYWYSLAQQSGNASVNVPMAALKQFYKPSTADERAVDRFVLNHTDISGNYVINLIQTIDNNPRFKDFKHLNTVTPDHVSVLSQVEETASYNSLLAETYKIVYEQFANEIANIAQQGNADAGQLKILQEYMRNIREHSANHPIDIIQPSMWETWTPN